ncbi:hypothetical protein INT48_001234, partial [Thamnidium elegans]
TLSFSRNRILDFSDESPGSPVILLHVLREEIAANLKEPELEKRNLVLVFKHLEVTKKLKNATFSSSLEVGKSLVHGLLDILEMSLKGIKRRSVDECIVSSSKSNSSNDCFTEVIWNMLLRLILYQASHLFGAF